MSGEAEIGRISKNALRGNTPPALMQQYDVVRGVKSRLDMPRCATQLYLELDEELVADLIADAVGEMEQALVTIALLQKVE